MDTSSLIVTCFVLLISLIVCAGGIYALVHQKVVVDEKGHVTSVEIPLFGKLKSNYPSLVAIFIGVGLAALVWQGSSIERDVMKVIAKLTLSEELGAGRNVFVGAIPDTYQKAGNVFSTGEPNEVVIEVERYKGYNVVAYTVTGITNDGFTEYSLTHGPAKVDDIDGIATFDAVLRGRTHE